MVEDLSDAFFTATNDRDPVRAAQKDTKKPRLKRFYKTVETREEPGGWALLLDGKPVRTPSGHRMRAPNEAIAREIAREWEAQAQEIDPSSMPMTRLANSALDGVAPNLESVADDIKKYFASDLVCYRAEQPDSLAAAQAAAWDPALDFARKALDAPLQGVAGLMFQEQPAEAIRAAGKAVDVFRKGEGAAWRLAALHVMTTLTGSALLPLAHLAGVYDLEGVWRAAHVDEDHQMRLWGEDAEALAGRAARWREMQAAAAILRSF